jgi:hypothetical protein
MEYQVLIGLPLKKIGWRTGIGVMGSVPNRMLWICLNQNEDLCADYHPLTAVAMHVLDHTESGQDKLY